MVSRLLSCFSINEHTEEIVVFVIGNFRIMHFGPVVNAEHLVQFVPIMVTETVAIIWKGYDMAICCIHGLLLLIYSLACIIQISVPQI